MEAAEGVKHGQKDDEGATKTVGAVEIRITQKGKAHSYISHALKVFTERGHNTVVVLIAMGRAMNKAVTIAEVLKRKIPLHQITTLKCEERMDVMDPFIRDDAVDHRGVQESRYVSTMSITLSRTCTEEGKKHLGYQPPLPPEEINPDDLFAV